MKKKEHNEIKDSKNVLLKSSIQSQNAHIGDNSYTSNVNHNGGNTINTTQNNGALVLGVIGILALVVMVFLMVNKNTSSHTRNDKPIKELVKEDKNENITIDPTTNEKISTNKTSKKTERKEALTNDQVAINEKRTTIPVPKVIKETVIKKNETPSNVSLNLVSNNNDELHSIASFFLGKKLMDQGINLEESGNKTGTDGELFCKIQMSKEELELGGFGLKVSFQINATLKNKQGQIIGKPYHKESPSFYIENEKKIPSAYKSWLDTLSDDLILK